MIRTILLLTCLMLLTAGCGSTEVAAKVDGAQTESSTAATMQVATEANAQEPEKPAPPVVADFQPPFPNRTELFDPPRGSELTVRRDDDQGEAIELKGFLDVNGPQVVLAIDGVLSPIPEGGEKYGVQVISINPPHAVLQRGRNRWTASLE